MLEKKRGQWWSLVGVIALAILLPAILRATNQVMRVLVGAEGRLAAIGVETDRVLGPLPAPWRALAQGGDNLRGFLDEITDPISEIGPEYIRIDHIYDEFGAVTRSENGLIFNWGPLDDVVAQIQETGAKPFFSLSYMPLAISSGDILAAPKEWEEWSEVVQRTIEHYSGELGIEDVYYEVWNEPDLFGNWRMGGSKDYKLLYMHSARGAANAQGVKPFKFGGPATTGLYSNWLNSFFPFILENRLRMDFFSWHRYDTDVAKYSEDVQNIDQWLDRHPYFAQVEKIVTELGPDPKAGGVNDNQAGAAHLVAVMRELMFKATRGFTFGVNGDFGIVGKPRYQALKLLDSLGEDRLALTGEGTWVKAIGAKNAAGHQVLLTNYDPKNQHSEVVPVTFLNLRDRQFNLRKTYLGETPTVEEVATTEAMLQEEVVMPPNAVVLVELEPVTNPE